MCENDERNAGHISLQHEFCRSNIKETLNIGDQTDLKPTDIFNFSF